MTPNKQTTTKMQVQQMPTPAEKEAIEELSLALRSIADRRGAAQTLIYLALQTSSTPNAIRKAAAKAREAGEIPSCISASTTATERLRTHITQELRQKIGRNM